MALSSRAYPGWINSSRWRLKNRLFAKRWSKGLKRASISTRSPNFLSRLAALSFSISTIDVQTRRSVRKSASVAFFDDAKSSSADDKVFGVGEGVFNAAGFCAKALDTAHV